jgi:serralysin
VGDDTLTGGAGADTLTGGTGDDLFIFADGAGDDSVTDFTAGSATDDVLDISAFSFADLAAVLAVTTQVASDAVIDLHANDSVTLLGVDKNDLHGDDFQL